MTGEGDATGPIGETDTRAAALLIMTALLRAAGLSTPESDARHLLAGVLGIGKAQLISAPGAPVGAAASRLNDAVERRLRHEPVSRILGCKEFYGRSFTVTSGVLDPRPDTETVVDLVLEIVEAEGWRHKPLRIADIGTGSGAILLTLLAELPQARGMATDVSQVALAVAEQNAVGLGVGARVDFVHTRGLGISGRQFDIIVSNPPYIASSAIAGLDADVREYDPRVALDGGDDGLDVYREIASNVNNLTGSCWVVLEVGAGQLHSVVEIFGEACGRGSPLERRVRRDLAGHDRAVAFRLHAPS